MLLGSWWIKGRDRDVLANDECDYINCNTLLAFKKGITTFNEITFKTLIISKYFSKLWQMLQRSCTYSVHFSL